MADNALTVVIGDGTTKTLRSTDKSSNHLQVTAVGAHKRTYKGTQTITVDGTSEPKTLTVPSGSDFAEIYCEGTADTDFVRYIHYAGVSATHASATAGKRLYHDNELSSAAPSVVEFAKGTGSGTCTLTVEYFSYE